MASNGDWGNLAEANNELADYWDGLDKLPEPGDNKLLDKFCADRRITVAGLRKFGTRLADNTTLVFAHPAALKFRDLTDGRRWAIAGSVYTELKLLKRKTTPAERVIICEGESDAVRLLESDYPCDIAVLGAGAKHWSAAYTDQLGAYAQVLIGLDADDAGDAGATKIMAALPTAVRFTPPANDWCETEELPELPDVAEPPPTQIMVTGGDLLKLEAPDNPSWFEHDLLPIGGLLIMHGWAKSFKTFQALDMLSALAQGEEWCGFEPTNEPARTCVIQFEIPWAYYKERCHALHKHARDQEAWNNNFLTFEPLKRPQLTAGNPKQEDRVRQLLVENEVNVVLIDPIRRASGSIDMDAEKDVRKMLSFFEKLQDEGITVIAVHHDSKAGAQSGGGDPLNMTGSGAFAGDPDSIVSISVPPGCTRDQPRRNLHFTLRNSAAILPRGMEMKEDGHIVYSTEAYSESKEEENDGVPI